MDGWKDGYTDVELIQMAIRATFIPLQKKDAFAYHSKAGFETTT